jgi:hypothetical protein
MTTKMTTRIGPRALQMLESVRRSTDAGETRTKASLIEPFTPKRTAEGQRQIIDKLISRGLLVNLCGPEDPASYFGRRGAALVITQDGRDVLEARKATR